MGPTRGVGLPEHPLDTLWYVIEDVGDYELEVYMVDSTARFNVTISVVWQGGWPGLFKGESQSKALDRAIADLNARGFRVVFLIKDQWSFGRILLTGLVAIVTLGFVVRKPNFLIVGEPINAAAASAAPQQTAFRPSPVPGQMG